ncbi:hypothetical protein SCOCK_580033 [Actinacidiphila cocklensis]|uniref:Uncharacterized protein n=1 Tax=Actinacidiphila cocklensis TaxID=887465 RepID=A0A9W4DX48_9ACTN|nr:hypothetical protein SCOCK_580033 [Actinacidiphila cocklensis]
MGRVRVAVAHAARRAGPRPRRASLWAKVFRDPHPFPQYVTCGQARAAPGRHAHAEASYGGPACP